MSAFEEFGVMPEIIKGIQEQGWELPRDIQAEAIPLILGGGDVMAAAETGSGKTGAFALPLVQVVHETLREMMSGKGNSSETIRISNEDRDPSIAISPDGFIVQSRNEQWVGARANKGVLSGRYYYEVIVNDEGLARVGWSTRSAKLDLGTDRNGFGYGGTGKKSNNRQFDTYGEPYGKGDVIGCYIDIDKGMIAFTKNGGNLDVAFEIPNNLNKFSFYPAFCIKNAELAFNFSPPWKYPPTFYGGNFLGIDEADPNNVTTGTTSAVTSKVRKPLAIILEPSRDLAQQTHDAITSFMAYLPAPKIEQVLLVGGLNAGPQIQALKSGVEIVTGTPGRIIDLLEGGTLDLSNIRFFVLDEADALVDKEKTILMKIYDSIPKSKELQVLMFSATLHSDNIKELGNKICRFPTWVDLKGKDAIPDTVDYAFVWADPTKDLTWQKPHNPIITDDIHYKDNVKWGTNPTTEGVSQAIKQLKPILLIKIINSYKMEQAMIFCRTKLDCDNLERYFQDISGAKGPMIDVEYSCAVLHSDRSQQERNANIKRFKDGEVRFLICTDVAARGIDIKELPYMINYTLPDKAEDFIHRIGRVGRAERMGLAISIVGSAQEKVWFHQCQSRGKNCNNTKLVEQGGCAIWYDEPLLWQQIQTRLNTTVPHLDSNFTLPSSQGTTYGQKKTGGEQAIFDEHAEEVKPLVTQLAVLEDNIQVSFWSLKAKFSKKS